MAVKTVCLLLIGAAASPQPLRISVYAPAGTVNRYLATAEDRARAAGVMQRFRATKVWVEGRRGDQYVKPELLREVRDDLIARGFQVSGGLTTVRGKTFGVASTGGRYWMNFQAEKTQRDIAEFFRENAAIFDEIMVDDFYATDDTSPESQEARGELSWSDYRRKLLVGLIDAMMLKPARAVRPGTRVIIKFPQWYDRFHTRGYDPPGMAAAADQIWVGTETRNPKTAEYGYVQPTEGYVNYRWLRSVAGHKTGGAWFDHIDCTAQNFLDQASQSVLAGAPELTLFNLSNLMEGHAGQPLLERALPKLFELAEKVRGRPAEGVHYYKPPSSDGEENLYLMDYLAAIGLPVVPESSYPQEARVVFLGSHAAVDPELLARADRSLRRGATVAVTPALLRRADPSLAEMAGVTVSAEAQPALAERADMGRRPVELATALEVDLGVEAPERLVEARAHVHGRPVPLVTARKARHGRLVVWNVRTFSEKDGGGLPPKLLGLPVIPQPLADAMRRGLLAPLGVRLEAPAQIGFYLLGDARVLYNFRDEPTDIRVDGKAMAVEANGLRWLDKH